MPDEFAIIGTSRSEMNEGELENRFLEGINRFSRKGKADETKWGEFIKHITYQVADLNDEKAYTELDRRINVFKDEWKKDINIIYYLAVAPTFFPIIATHLA